MKHVVVCFGCLFVLCIESRIQNQKQNMNMNQNIRGALPIRYRNKKNTKPRNQETNSVEDLDPSFFFFFFYKSCLFVCLLLIRKTSLFFIFLFLHEAHVCIYLGSPRNHLSLPPTVPYTSIQHPTTTGNILVHNQKRRSSAQV